SHVSNPVTIGDYGKTGWARAGAHLRRVAQQGRGLFLQIPFTTDGNLSPDGAPAASNPSPVVAAFGAVGIMGYAAGPRVHMVDEFGLGDPLAARTRFVTLRLPPGFIVPTRPGQPRRYIVIPTRHRARHEKYLPTEWVVARFAPPGVARYSGVDLSPNGVAAARRALACPDLRRPLRAVTAPMTSGRFR